MDGLYPRNHPKATQSMQPRKLAPVGRAAVKRIRQDRRIRPHQSPLCVSLFATMLRATNGGQDLHRGVQAAEGPKASKFIVVADSMREAIDMAWEHGGADFQAVFDKATGQAEEMKRGVLRVL